MATLRAFLSVSTFLNPSSTSVSRVARSRSRFALLPRSQHVKISSRAPASRGLTQGLSDSDTEAHRREELVAVRRNNADETATTGVESVSASELFNFRSANAALGSFVSDNARELAIGALVFALVCLPDERAQALGPGGPLMEEFWDNVRRYGFYFFTVVSGGLYSLTKPLLDLLKDPSTQILVVVVVAGTLYLTYLTVSTMLGLNDFVYQYSQ